MTAQQAWFSGVNRCRAEEFARRSVRVRRVVRCEPDDALGGVKVLVEHDGGWPVDERSFYPSGHDKGPEDY